MEYDRIQVKRTARDIVRTTHPRPWLVTLVFFLLTSALLYGIWFIAILPAGAASYAGGYRHYAMGSASAFLILFLMVFSLLFAAVMQIGYRGYCMKLYRRQPTEIKDIFSGFSMVGRSLSMFGWIFLFTFLWTLPAIVIMVAGAFLAEAAQPEFLSELVYLISYLLALAFLYNRILPYSMSYYILLDHPEYRPKEALEASKAMMAGRKWSFFVLHLSFIGWYLLVALVFFVVMFVGIWIVICVIFAAGAYGNLENALSSLMFAMVFPALLLLITLLATLPLELWLTAYAGTASVGFYDCAAGTEGAPPPPALDGPAGNFYTGFPTAPDTWDSDED